METNNQNATGALFTPELIDIITPKSKQARELRAPDSNSSESTKNKDQAKIDFLTLSNKSSDRNANLNSLCLVIEYIDTDLDQILKH